MSSHIIYMMLGLCASCMQKPLAAANEANAHEYILFFMLLVLWGRVKEVVLLIVWG